tara:strand:+ start:264 stop:1148 length:885 start_codon:yes stop_codon:yes gene_type:complete
MSKITDLLKEVSKDVLTEESLEQIETVFTEAVNTKAEERAQITTEAALATQDDEHSVKLEQLLESIDKDHTKKLNKVVEAVDMDRTRKLKNVIRRYQTAINEEATGLKDTVVESVSDYLDSYIEESVPTSSIDKATTNKRAFDLLKDMRKMLSVDMVLANESIREAVQDGKKTIDESRNVVKGLTTSNTELATELQQTKKDLFIEKRIGQFDEKKSNFIRKTFTDRDLSFIEENFDYTVNMFDKKAQESLDILKEEAIHETKTQDAQVEMVKESSDTPKSAVNFYAQELANMRL